MCALALVWEFLARLRLWPELLFPSLSSVFASLASEIAHGEIAGRTWYSLSLIGTGLGLAILASFLASSLAMLFPACADALSALMAVLHPLPAIAILPILLLWFKTGPHSIVLLILFSAFWPLTASIHAGLRSVPVTQVEVGKNLGLKGFGLVWNVMLPAALPAIIAGLRVGWARAWQASVAAEMVFGASGKDGGLGWFLYKKRYFLEVPAVFAGMLVIIAIGLLVENLLYKFLERQTIERWGMSSE
ncbi:MAG: sulfonate transport system permease protein [Bacillota bacterium]|nr:sulfonate transport system permease protein [Bacillota bacterium]MDK2925459.1 sulfonate transport system permease protein [Bacillota bacterium]MDK2960629.1 sulfonate transport system permease protein [Bacillota bacterium]